MPDKQTEDLENKPTETQENTPDVSANQKEEEVSKNQENTEINLTNLQADIAKKLETVKDDTTKQKLEQMQKDVEDNKNDQDFLEKKAKELKGMKDTDPTRWEKNKTSVYKWFAKSSL